MQSLIPTVIGLGLAVALCSPVSVVTVIVLLTMPSGRRRGIAFVLGWLLAIGVIAAFVVGYLETLTAYLISPAYRTIPALLLLVVVMYIRPQGLLGRR